MVIWSTCIGNTSTGSLADMTVDDEGNVYQVSNFETSQPFDQGFTVTKLDRDGALLFSQSYSFAPWAEEARAIAVGPGHSIYVAGLMSGEYPQSEFILGFVLKLDPSGSSVVYYTTLSDGLLSIAEDLAVDAEGRAYAIVSGDYSSQYNLWRLSADGAIAERFGPGLSAWLESVDVGSAGDIYATGTAMVDGNMYEAGMVARISPSGTLVYRTLLNEDGLLFWPTAAVAAPGGGAYVTGYTGSPGDPEDAFVARFNAVGVSVGWRLLGGSGEESGSAIAVTPSGGVLVAGSTNSPDFPLRNPQSGNPAGFLVRLDAALAGIQETTTLGRSLAAVDTDSSGKVYAAGFSSECPGGFAARLSTT